MVLYAGNLGRMKTPFPRTSSNRGRIPLLLLWLVGIPFPILLIIFLLRGCS